MTARVTVGTTGASVAYAKLRAAVTVVEPVTSVTRVIPVTSVSYILLSVATALDTSGRYRYLTDAFTVVDGMRFSLTKGFADAFDTADTPPVLEVTKGLSDSVSFTEVFSAILVFLRDLTDTQSFSDAPAWSLDKPLSDSVGFSESTSFVLTRSFSDGFAMNDSFDMGDGAVFTVTKSINNVVFLSDTFSQIITKTVADSVTMSDSGLGSMQSYCDITYFAEDYVGISFTF
jgi:hypothetical protein